MKQYLGSSRVKKLESFDSCCPVVFSKKGNSKTRKVDYYQTQEALKEKIGDSYPLKEQ